MRGLVNTNINVPIEFSGTVMSAVATSSRLKLAALQSSFWLHSPRSKHLFYLCIVQYLLLLKFLTRNKAELIYLLNPDSYLLFENCENTTWRRDKRRFEVTKFKNCGNQIQENPKHPSLDVTSEGQRRSICCQSAENRGISLKIRCN